MAKKIYIGSSDFIKIITNDGLFADKSLYIKEIIEDANDVLLLARPRRWGKTLSQSMLQAFLSPEVNGVKTSGLFDNLAIAGVDEGKYIKNYQGKCPVIFISFKDVKERTFSNCIKKLSLVIYNLFVEHDYLLKSDKLQSYDKEKFSSYLAYNLDEINIAESIKTLSYLLHKHFSQKVYVLIDEYDTPLNEAYLSEYLNDLTDLMRNLFSSALKDNPNLEKGVMTGILRISKDSMLSGLNNLEVYTILDKKYSEYFGFTDEELDLLFKEQGLERNEEHVKKWYDGYNFGGCHIYNPWSILNCLSKGGELGAYWINTGSTAMIDNLLTNFKGKAQGKIMQLMEKQEISQKIDKHVAFYFLLNDESALWSLLLFSGYLTARVDSLDSDDATYNCSLRVPNQEVITIFNRHYNKWFMSLLGDDYEPFLKSLLSGDVDSFSRYLNQYLLEVISFRDNRRLKENFYHGLMLGLLASLRGTHLLHSNRESGLGFYDVSLTPLPESNLDLAIVLELKYAEELDNLDKLANSALTQIVNKKYDVALKQQPQVARVLYLGLAFNQKQVKVASKLIDG